uniref:Histone-lysine N-methyltransferase SETMAR n=1 Tax=Schistocephalus solidus TaxID=70667 RepID=A0A0X3PUA5_SCHSO
MFSKPPPTTPAVNFPVYQPPLRTHTRVRISVCVRACVCVLFDRRPKLHPVLSRIGLRVCLRDLLRCVSACVQGGWAWCRPRGICSAGLHTANIHLYARLTPWEGRLERMTVAESIIGRFRALIEAVV